MQQYAKPTKSLVAHLEFRNRQRRVTSYLFANLPSASANANVNVRVIDRLQRLAISDGSNWRFSDDNSVVV